MATHGLVPYRVLDLTREAIPYWELRSASHHRTGIEQAFLNAHRSNHLNFLVMAADKSSGSAWTELQVSDPGRGR